MRHRVLLGASVLLVCAGRAQDKPTPIEPPGVASGKQTYMQFCASCHREYRGARQWARSFRAEDTASRPHHACEAS